MKNAAKRIFTCKIGADTAENEQHLPKFCQKLATTLRVSSKNEWIRTAGRTANRLGSSMAGTQSRPQRAAAHGQKPSSFPRSEPPGERRVILTIMMAISGQLSNFFHEKSTVPSFEILQFEDILEFSRYPWAIWGLASCEQQSPSDPAL